MAHELPGWEVTILGTDINRRSLARAREGKFEAWSLRSTPEDLKRNCFQNEGKLWSLAPEYKQWVTFQYHNLVEHSFPSPLNNLFCFDLIVCRNVMIYFGPDLMQRTIRQFHECLVPGLPTDSMCNGVAVPGTYPASCSAFNEFIARFPTLNQHTGYAEVRRVLHPMAYLAARVRFALEIRTSQGSGEDESR